MRRGAAIAVTVATGSIGVLLLAPPVLAATRSGSTTGTTATCPCDGTGAGPRAGMGAGAGTRAGAGARAGTGTRAGTGMGAGARGFAVTPPGADLPATGTLSSDQKSRLAAMAEEEKLAHDVYTALAADSGDARFTRIAASEQRHLDAVRTVLARYGTADPTDGRAIGEFATAATARSYTDLVARGSVSLDAALSVGRAVEAADIADLRTAASGVTAPDVTALYAHLSAASAQHLRAFGG